MKFWEIVTLFQVEMELQGKDILSEILNSSKWVKYNSWYINFDNIVSEQQRTILDKKVPYSLCTELFSKSIRKYYLVENKYLIECGQDFDEPKTNYTILTALEVYEKYGGSCMEIIQEKGKYTPQLQNATSQSQT